MAEKATETEALGAAVRCLAARCDGAATEDGQGFNKLDAPLGRKLAAVPEATWTPRQRRAAWSMLAKYRGQLEASGIDHDSIPEPPTPEAGERRPDWAGVEKEGERFVLGFDYDPELVSAVKEIPGRRFSRDDKTWRVPASLEALEPLVDFVARYNLDASAALMERVHEVAASHEARVEASRAADADFEVEGLGGELRPFQRAGVAYAVRARRCFLADEMGLGKTVEALATVQAVDAYPALVVCPASLKLNWAREAGRWLPGRSVAVMNGKSAAPDADIVVINYDVLAKHAGALKGRGFGSVILDESHYCKNHKAKRTKLCTELAEDVPLRLLLSGTPMLSRPQELLSQLAILGRLGDFGGFWTFANRYCAAERTRFGLDLSGASNLPELNTKLRATCYVRRTKEEVLKELPPKQRSVVPVALENAAEYRRAERDVVRYLGETAANDKRRIAEAVAGYEDEHGEKPDAAARGRIVSGVRASAEAQAERAEQLVRIGALKQEAARGKLDEVGRWVEDFLESGEKLVLFGWHREVVDALAERFGAPRIAGDTPAEGRPAAVDAFQGDPETRLLVCNVRAGGVGLTLTAASNVAFCELGWTPAEHDQAEDRCHRIGQEAGSVNAWYLLAEGTIDDEIHGLIEKKRAVVDAATEGSGEAARSSVLSDLAERLMAKADGKG